MRISEIAYRLLREFEGFRSKVYSCPGGYKTIGYGHMLTQNENLTQISLEQAEQILQQDIFIAEKSVFNNITIFLTQGQFDALVLFTFNVGGAAFQRSTLRQKVNRGEHDEVLAEFMRWIYSGGIKIPGLIHRRKMEANLYLN